VAPSLIFSPRSPFGVFSQIIGLEDIEPPASLKDFEDVYVVTDLMETDLHRIIYSKQDLTDEHVQFFVYQMLCALKYMHSAGVVHR
jgi:mitogen-activated protein kinase 1/3